MKGLTLFRWKRVLLLSFGFLELRLVEGGYFGNVGLICHYEKLQGERERRRHLISRIHYNGWLQDGRKEITRRKGGERKKRMASGACSHPPAAAAIEAPLTFSLNC